MTGWQRHAIYIPRIPCGDQMAARVGVLFQSVDKLHDLVDLAPVGGFPVAPLMAVNRTEVAVLIGPFVPDANSVFFQVTDVGIALQKPQQLVNDRAQVQLLGGKHRKAGAEVEAHLPAEHRARTRTGAVCFWGALFENMAHQVKVLSHGFSLSIHAVNVSIQSPRL